MNCEEVQERLLARAGASDAAANAVIDAHLAGCPTCRAVAEARLEEQRSSPGDLTALFAAVQGDLARERGPIAWLCSRPTWVRRSMIFGFAIAIGALGLVAMRRPDLAVYPSARFILELGLLAAALAVAVGAAVRARLEVPGGRLASALLVLAIGVPVVLAVLPQAHADHPASLLGAGADLASRALGCLVWGLIMAAPTAAIAFLARRDGGSEPRRDLLLGGAAGLAGVIALEVHCPITHSAHLLLGHATVVAVVVAAVALAGWFGGRTHRHRVR